MKKVLLVLALVIGITTMAAGFLVARAVRQFEEPYRAYEGDELQLDIAPGTSARAILEDLESRGVIRNALHARLFLVRSMADAPLKAGEYRFDRPMTSAEVLDKLARGEVSTHPVTIVEGLSLEETAKALHDAEFGDEGSFLEAMRNPSLVEDLDPGATTLEGYLFPDTYFFARGTTEKQIVATLVDTFRHRTAGLDLGPDPDLRALVTLASIVEKEAQLDEERALIAAVFSNRLERGIPLGADPTVIFALKLAGRWDGNIRKADLSMPSPYNTYVNAGLPPGPICSPGLASLEAAAAPAESTDLYFVSRNDGSHVFSRTLAEHNRNVEKWQRQYWRRRWAQERAKKD